MEQSYFMKIYKKRWRYRFIVLFLWGIGIIGLIYQGAVTYYNSTNNPTIVKTESDYMKAVQNNSYIKIDSKELYDLGIELVETKSKHGKKLSEHTKAMFTAINLDGKILAVSLPPEVYKEMMEQKKVSYLLVGNIKEFKNDDLRFFKNILITDGFSAKEVNSLLHRNYLHYITPSHLAAPYFILAVCIAIALIALFIPCMYRNTKALKSLKNYSNGNLEKAYEEIDNEIKLWDVYKKAPFTVTPNYIIVESQAIVFAMPLNELMWVYKSTVQSKLCRFIPLGMKIDSIVFVFSDKRTYKIDLYRKGQRIDETIQYISKHCNTSIVGFSQELKDLLKKNPNEFIRQWRMRKEMNMTDL
ncbi:DUF6709 family protein [Clostridium ganghwense]|uniref:TPM domain-containing protein n=1 Tax=Clostridium ganghwense TaxID=312089 RepID=A0ABT4CMX1_9CLOT|nr:DUF6709 family protein [Clostridium ganghwense]MCY6369344.1 hypothetical protein [Clostridium ganghwense]